MNATSEAYLATRSFNSKPRSSPSESGRTVVAASTAAVAVAGSGATETAAVAVPARFGRGLDAGVAPTWSVLKRVRVRMRRAVLMRGIVDYCLSGRGVWREKWGREVQVLYEGGS